MIRGELKDVHTTVTLIGRGRVALALEDVAEMTATVGADNLSALHTKGTVGVSCDSSGDSVEEGRPAAS